ncbi:mechanosensitive ion channel domain-containing protein [Daeguia caeni]|uniref:Mechanosensitive ion channel domain-containing protein n=1 Tax=Daeguia caeni TaxID=439612 RepID=A0ABV9H6W4_9HYPH
MAFLSSVRSVAFALLVLSASFGTLSVAHAQGEKAHAVHEQAATKAASAQAEQPQTTSTDEFVAPSLNIAQQQKPVIDDLKKQAKTLEAQLEKAAASDEALANLKIQLDSLSKRLLDAGVTFRPRLAEINSRLDQLGPAPADNQPPEPIAIAEERARLLAEKAEINAIIGETESTSVAVSQLASQVSNLRRELFTKTLSQRVSIDAALGPDVVAVASAQMQSLWRVVQSWWRFVIAFKLNSFLAAAFFALATALVIQFGARRLLGAIYERDPAIERPTYLSRLLVAFWSTVIPSAAVAAFLATTYLLLNYFNVLRTDIASLLQSLFFVLGLVYFIHRLAWATISPDMPAWKLVPVAPRSGRILAWLITATSLTTGLDSFFGTVNRILSSPLSLTVAKSLLATVMVGVFILLIAFLKPIQRNQDDAVRPWPHAFKVFLIFLGLAPIITGVSGYIGLARFISQQIVVTGAFLVTMYLGFLTGRAIGGEQAFASSKIGKTLHARFHFDATTLDQFGLLAGILINLVVAMIGIPLVLMQLGFQWAELTTAFYRLMTGFQIGSISISLMGLLTGLCLFAVGYLLTRWFQNWLDNSVMARGRVDAGVRNSIRTVVGYVGLCLAMLVGISAAGFNLSNLALIAGGLSLGIGFGLQNIVQNFVSGLILLAERPFKVGDWVETGGVSGVVKKISVRATEVETFQKQSIIVPNSSLINGNVGNWTHRNKLGRIEITIQAAYTPEPRRLHALLLDIARGHPAVLKNPEPSVVLKDMTGSQLVFDMLAHVADITSTSSIKNELRFQIIERFNEEGFSLTTALTKLVLSPSELDKQAELQHEGHQHVKAKVREAKAATEPKDDDE